MQKELTKAYIAGLFDGEGIITLTYHSSKDEFRSPTVSMSNTSYELLDFILKEYGGSIVKQKVYKDHHKQSWSWRLKRRKALNFLSDIAPYMKERTKLKRAKTLLNEYLKVTPRNGKYSEKMKVAKLAFENDFFAS